MKFKKILESIKLDSEEYLNESILKKGKRYFVVKNSNKKEFIAGTKEEGYASLENAVKSMLDQTNSNFKKLNFDEKKERVDKYIKKWKKENNVIDKKPKRKNGFEQILFSTEE